MLRNSTQEEIAAYDKLILSRPEFTVYTNLSRFLNEQPNSFSVVSSSNGSGKSGLAWMLALARLELMAMTSVYGNEQELAALRPPTQFESNAFRDLLFDGMRSHVWSLSSDGRFAEVKGRVPGAETFAYARRTTLALSFIRAVASMYGQSLNAQQQAQLTQWKEDVGDQSEILREKIYAYLSEQDVETTESKRKFTKASDSKSIYCRRDCLQKMEEARAWLDKR